MGHGGGTPLSSGLWLLGGGHRAWDVSQGGEWGRGVVAGVKLALDNETLTLLHSFCFHHH